MSEELHLVKIPLRPDGLARFAKQRDLPMRELDDGYVAHWLLRDVWKDRAPAPFVLKSDGRHFSAWGYSGETAGALVEYAKLYGDPTSLQALAPVDDVVSKALPPLAPGRVVGFELRACPVVRLSKGRAGHRAGAEIDAFLARCFEVGEDVQVSRDEVYLSWLTKTLGNTVATGAKLLGAKITGHCRQRLTRRTHADKREAKHLERPVVHFVGQLCVGDPTLFRAMLARGVGRHRAFGFGAVMLAPPSNSAS